MLPNKSKKKKKWWPWGDCGHMKLLIEIELYIKTAQCMKEALSLRNERKAFLLVSRDLFVCVCVCVCLCVN